MNIQRRYESDEESSDDGELTYEEPAASCKELYTRSKEVIAQLLAEKNKLVSAISDLQNEVTLLSSKLEKQKKTINEFCLEKEKLMSMITDLQEENTLLNSKLENMTKYVRMLNNGSNVLDEILQVGMIFGNKKGIGFDYGTVNKEIKIPTKKFVPPKKKTEFVMLDHMSQHPVRHLNPQPRNKKKSPWICHHCGRSGHIRPYCYKLYGYPQKWGMTTSDKLRKIGFQNPPELRKLSEILLNE